MWLDEYRQVMLADNVEEVEWKNALELKYQNIPSSLYKYRSCSEYAIENLLQDEMWFNSAAQMNDPYDSALTVEKEHYIFDDFKKELIRKVLPRFHEELNIANNSLELKELETKSIADVIRHLFVILEFEDYDKEKIEKYYDEMKELINASHDEAVQIFNETGQKATFISCFSERNDSILMWSHYTGNHQGFCIEYNFKKPEVDSKLTNKLYPVLYNKKLFNLSNRTLRSLVTESNARRPSLLCPAIIKSQEWAYEKEWRIVYFPEKKETGFNKKFFTPEAIYLGTKISKEDKEKLMEIAEIKQISVYQMKMKSDEFELKAEKIF